ncbi:hypothetical protein HS7_19520 [Sulfolobales archaeon HS-7]|nr:hypothetical protein HS7_19520 [Sulfolobales archaeon HS-7]
MRTLSVKLSEELAEKLDVYVMNKGISRSSAIRDAILQYIKEGS